LVEDLLVGDTLLSRSVRDAAWAFATTTPESQPIVQFDPRAPRLRIGLCLLNFSGDPPAADVEEVVRKTAATCARLGHHVEEIPLPFDGPGVDRCFRTIWAYLAQDLVAGCRSSLPAARIEDVLEPWTLGLASSSHRLSTRDLDLVFEQVTSASRALAMYYNRYDVLLSPVLKHAPPPLGTLSPDQPFDALVDRMFDYVSYTPLQNLTGTPAMSVPLYMSRSGLPIGSMFAAARGNDALLLQLAFELERAEPWAGKWPQLSAAMA
jgi:amidase